MPLDFFGLGESGLSIRRGSNRKINYIKSKKKPCRQNSTLSIGIENWVGTTDHEQKRKNVKWRLYEIPWKYDKKYNNLKSF